MERAGAAHVHLKRFAQRPMTGIRLVFMITRLSVKLHLTFGSVVVVAACLFTTSRVQGMDQYTYDMDSLVYMSPQIVEGKLGAESRANNVTVSDFKISAVHEGNLKVGRTIQVTALDFYRVAGKGFWNGRKLRSGDQFFLFGDRAKKAFLYDIPDDAEIYWPAPSGVWLVVGEKALDFWQFDNPGPYVAVLDGTATNTAIPTVVELQMQIRRSLKRVEKWRPMLEREATTNDIPALLEILRTERNIVRYIPPGSITAKACSHLAAMHDISALTNALDINDKLFWALSSGFDCLAGRQFLWSKIADEKQPIDERIKWANFLSKAGEGNQEEHQLKRIAEFAVRHNQDQKIQAILLDSLQQLQNWWRFTHRGNGPDATIQAGVDEATSVLKSFHEKTDSEDLKHKIDLILEEFSGEKEAIISILSFGSYDASARRLKYNYDISTWKSTNMTTEIVFHNVNTGNKLKMPANLDLEPAYSGNSGGIKDVTLPKDLPNGRYRVFYEFSHDGKVVSASHSFETDF
jgi:hypothetical protein